MAKAPEGPIKAENWRGEDGEMREWMRFALAGRGDAHSPLLRVVEFADRMFGIAAQPGTQETRHDPAP